MICPECEALQEKLAEAHQKIGKLSSENSALYAELRSVRKREEEAMAGEAEFKHRWTNALEELHKARGLK